VFLYLVQLVYCIWFRQVFLYLVRLVYCIWCRLVFLYLVQINLLYLVQTGISIFGVTGLLYLVPTGISIFGADWFTVFGADWYFYIWCRLVYLLDAYTECVLVEGDRLGQLFEVLLVAETQGQQVLRVQSLLKLGVPCAGGQVQGATQDRVDHRDRVQSRQLRIWVCGI